jgi:hypothetical protein
MVGSDSESISIKPSDTGANLGCPAEPLS